MSSVVVGSFVYLIFGSVGNLVWDLTGLDFLTTLGTIGISAILRNDPHRVTIVDDLIVHSIICRHTDGTSLRCSHSSCSGMCFYFLQFR